MADRLPFVNSRKDAQLAREFYLDSDIVRLPLQSTANPWFENPRGRLWVDAGVDGFSQPQPSPEWQLFSKKFSSAEQFAQQLANPTRQTVDSFVQSVLDSCLKLQPEWISVPQLPHGRGVSSNQINRLLAAATDRWRRKQSFRGLLILPIILTRQDQYSNRTNRRPRLNVARACFEQSGAEGYWIVDADLADQSGTGTFESKRFPGFIAFCEEARASMARATVSVAGPFWGLNLVLWARGIVKYPAISLGTGYRYHIAGGRRQNKPTVRLALEPLRRWATVGPMLRSWLREAVSKTQPGDQAHHTFAELLNQLDQLNDEDRARRQVVRFYKRWYDHLANTPPQGRALALYQDLSAAYVLGKSLNDLPSTEKSARRPERVARQLMVNCL